MIDTDKYEGHTRGPWRYYDDEEHDCWVFEGEDIEAQARVAFFAFTPCEGIAYLDDPDLNLMIDAPLLLAEVERLREALINVQRSLVWDEKDRAMFGEPITLEALFTQVEQVRSDITEMIE